MGESSIIIIVYMDLGFEILGKAVASLLVFVNIPFFYETARV